MPLGDTSGEKIAAERRTPTGSGRSSSCACGSTSRISTSTTISARGLSFCSMIFSRIRTTDARAADGDRVGRLVGDDRRLHRDAGQPDDRAEHLRASRSRRRATGRTCGPPARRTARAWCGVSWKTKIDRSLTTLYDSWFIVMIWLSACSSVTPCRPRPGRGVCGRLDGGGTGCRRRVGPRAACPCGLPARPAGGQRARPADRPPRCREGPAERADLRGRPRDAAAAPRLARRGRVAAPARRARPSTTA